MDRTRRAFISAAVGGVTGSWLTRLVPALRAQLVHTFPAASVTRLQATLE
jgi:hypothetical protein